MLWLGVLTRVAKGETFGSWTLVISLRNIQVGEKTLLASFRDVIYGLQGRRARPASRFALLGLARALNFLLLCCSGSVLLKILTVLLR